MYKHSFIYIFLYLENGNAKSFCKGVFYFGIDFNYT